MARKNYKEKVEVADIKQLDSNTENEAENIVSIQKEEIIGTDYLQLEIDALPLKNNHVILTQVDANGNECCPFTVDIKTYQRYYTDTNKYKLKKK